MAKEKDTRLSQNRDLGEVKKKLTSGIFETNKGEKIPPMPGVGIGTKLKLEAGKFVVVSGKKEQIKAAVDEKDKKVAELEAKIDALEKLVGERGAKVTATDDKVNEATTNIKKNPPKVGE